MRAYNLWNADFDDLMTDLDTFLVGNPDITVTHLDWKYAQTTEHRAYWYLVLLYTGELSPVPEGDATPSSEDSESPE